MSHIRSFIQYIFIVIAIANTFEITAAEHQEPLLSQDQSASQLDIKRNAALPSRTFWESLNNIYAGWKCCRIQCCILGYNSPSISAIELALRNPIISNSRQGRSPLMAATQEYVKWDHPSYLESFRKMLAQLARQEKRQAEKIAVLRYSIQQNSKDGVYALLTATDISAEPTILIEALIQCQKRRQLSRRVKKICCAECDEWSTHTQIIEALLQKGADRSLAIQLTHLYQPCCKTCPAQKIFAQAQPIAHGPVAQQFSDEGQPGASIAPSAPSAPLYPPLEQCSSDYELL